MVSAYPMPFRSSADMNYRDTLPYRIANICERSLFDALRLLARMRREPERKAVGSR